MGADELLVSGDVYIDITPEQLFEFFDELGDLGKSKFFKLLCLNNYALEMVNIAIDALENKEKKSVLNKLKEGVK